MGKVNEKNLNVFLSTEAIMMKPKDFLGMPTVGGIIIVTETLHMAKLFVKQYICENLAQEWSDLEVKYTEMLNFQIGFHIYRRDDKEKKVIDFLEEKDFLPVLVVVGLVPTFLADYSFICRVNRLNLNDPELAAEKLFHKWIINNIPVVIEILRNSVTSEEMDVSLDDCFEIYSSIIASVQVRCGYERSLGNFEADVKKRENSFLAWALDIMEESDRYTGMFQVTEVVKDLLYIFIGDNEECKFVHLDKFDENVYVAMQKNEVILYDEEFYYLPERLLKAITHSLLKTVTFNQVKAELSAEGALVCNDTEKPNFTIKKLFSINSGKTIVRPRLIKINRVAFMSSDGFFPEQSIC